jgi:hypothetical protein
VIEEALWVRSANDTPGICYSYTSAIRRQFSQLAMRDDNALRIFQVPLDFCIKFRGMPCLRSHRPNSLSAVRIAFIPRSLNCCAIASDLSEFISVSNKGLWLFAT